MEGWACACPNVFAAFMKLFCAIKLIAQSAHAIIIILVILFMRGSYFISNNIAIALRWVLHIVFVIKEKPLIITGF
jgi:hypothetical protein